MKAVQFTLTIPRYVFGLAVGNIYPPLLWGGLSCTALKDVPEPSLPGSDWVRVANRYGGMCGTDLNAIHLHVSPYFDPLSSGPFTLGHENVGHITELGGDVVGWEVGQRVVVEPNLGCEVRGIDPLCAYCQRGEVNRCQNYAEGGISAGIILGSCRDTGGSWSRSFTAHKSQLYAVPENVSDENALMVEPFSIGLHAALLDFPADDETILILGAGTIGLVQLAALRVLGSKAHVIMSARYPFQAEAARKLDADEVVMEDLYSYIAEVTNGKLYKPMIGKKVLMGGVDRVYECVGTDSVLDDAMRLAGSGGKVVLVGIPGLAKNVDWSALFSKELTVLPSVNFHHVEEWGGKQWKAFDLTLKLMADGDLDLGWMVTHRYDIAQFKTAMKDQRNKKNNHIIKAVFDFGG